MPYPADTAAGALEPSRRVQLLDALRGAALFGVLLINMLWFAGMDNSVADEQFANLPTAGIDRVADYVVNMLVYAKFIGIFSLLFGVSFAMQMGRLLQRTADAVRIYSRRLIGLLAIGLVHWLGVWSGEILHVYALAGFLLLLVFRWRSGVLLAVGLPVAVLARPLLERLDMLFGTGTDHIGHQSSQLFAERLHVFLHGSYLEVIGVQLRQDSLPYIVSGAMIAAIFHAFSRFMVGVAVARGRYLEEPHKHIRAFRAIAGYGLLIGFIAQHDWALVSWLESAGWVTNVQLSELTGHVCNSFGVVSMTAGYVAAFVLMWQSPSLQRVLAGLVPIGQMALTNYLLQTVLNYLLFFGFGLGLMGHTGVAACVALSIVLFLGQVALSQWWMHRFRYGPVEWLWRWWTYRKRPALVRVRDEIRATEA
jgi:uncharacterized protein